MYFMIGVNSLFIDFVNMTYLGNLTLLENKSDNKNNNNNDTTTTITTTATPTPTPTTTTTTTATTTATATATATTTTTTTTTITTTITTTTRLVMLLYCLHSLVRWFVCFIRNSFMYGKFVEFGPARKILISILSFTVIVLLIRQLFNDVTQECSQCVNK